MFTLWHFARDFFNRAYGTASIQGLLALPLNAHPSADFAPNFVKFSCNTQSIAAKIRLIQDKRPNKRIYSITEDGCNALRGWLNEAPPAFENPHEPLLMRVFFGANAPEITLALLKAIRDMCLAHLEERLEKNSRTAINNYASAIPDGEKASLYWQMTLNLGIT